MLMVRMDKVNSTRGGILMRGKYGITVFGEKFLGMTTGEMLDWVGLFRQHLAGSTSDPFGGATTMRVQRIATHRRTLNLTTTAMREFTRCRG